MQFIFILDMYGLYPILTPPHIPCHLGTLLLLILGVDNWVILPLYRSVDPDLVGVWVVPAEEGLLEVLAKVPHLGLGVVEALGEEVDGLVRRDWELLNRCDGRVPGFDLGPATG